MNAPKSDKYDVDTLLQRPRGPTIEEYLELLRDERTYLEGEINKLATKKGLRAALICDELREALKESIESQDLLKRGKFIGALATRDRMHIRLHQTKGFQWQPLMKRGEKFKPGRPRGAIGPEMAHIQQLIHDHPQLKPKQLWLVADKSILEGMNERTFANKVSIAKNPRKATDGNM